VVRNLNRRLQDSAAYQEIMSCIRIVRENLKSSAILNEKAVDGIKFSNKKAELEQALIDLNKSRRLFISDLRNDSHSKIISRVKAVIINDKKEKD
jgi:hypothetical protein